MIIKIFPCIYSNHYASTSQTICSLLQKLPDLTENMVRICNQMERGVNTAKMKADEMHEELKKSDDFSGDGVQTPQGIAGAIPTMV